MSKVTVRQAAFLTDKSRETINKKVNNGDLSFGLDSKGHKVIDIAELQREYEIVRTIEEMEAQSTPVKAVKNLTTSSQSIPSEEVFALEVKMAKLEGERDLAQRERDLAISHMESRIEDLEMSLKHSRGQETYFTRMLTDQSEKTESRGAKRDEEMAELKRALRIQQLKHRKMTEKIEELQERPLWQRILGAQKRKSASQKSLIRRE